MKKSSIMKKLYNSRVFWAIIAVLASVSLWVYVIGQETEEYKQTFRGVRVELVGEDILLNTRNMVITDLSTSTVTVEVSGPRRIVGSWSSDDLIAQDVENDMDIGEAISREEFWSNAFDDLFNGE